MTPKEAYKEALRRQEAEAYEEAQRSLGEKEDFLRRIIPLALEDTRFGTWHDHVAYAGRRSLIKAMGKLATANHT
jgi:hypothetical protein